MKTLTTIICVCLLAGVVSAQTNNNPREQAKKVAEQAYKENAAKYAGNADVLVKPGVLADRKNGMVKVWGVATGVGGGDPVEFALIPADSGKDYESLALAFASAADVDEALKFIGLKPGRAVDYARMMYWARGPRVSMTFGWTDDKGQAHEQPVRMLLRNTQTNKAWEGEWVYTGSRTDVTPEGVKVWLAGISDSAAIGSTYSNPASVLDVADRASQADVYGSIKSLEKMPFGNGQPLVVTLRRVEGVGEVDVALTVREVDGRTRLDVGDEKGLDWVATLAKFEQMVGGGRVPFVTVHWADDLKMGDAVKAAAMLGQIEGPKGIRIEPPALVPGTLPGALPGAGRLYYRALLPNPKWRDPKERVFNGWDVTLPLKTGGSITAVERADVRDEQTGVYSTVAQSHTVADGAALAKLLAERDGERPRDVYLHVPADLTCGTLNGQIAPILAHHLTVYVFVD